MWKPKYKKFGWKHLTYKALKHTKKNHDKFHKKLHNLFLGQLHFFKEKKNSRSIKNIYLKLDKKC